MNIADALNEVQDKCSSEALESIVDVLHRLNNDVDRLEKELDQMEMVNTGRGRRRARSDDWE